MSKLFEKHYESDNDLNVINVLSSFVTNADKK